MHLSFLSASLLAAAAVTVAAPTAQGDCKCFPGDACWPSDCDWGYLNATVQGRLIATEPLAAPCHKVDPNGRSSFNNDECSTLQDEWLFSPIHMDSSSSVMAPLFANASCDPFLSSSSPCTLGNYVSYSINASSPWDIQQGIKFASEKNIRLVIRNTGHDYHGRSTGAGALSIWTHYLKDTEIVDWADEFYTGKALKAGAGVQGFEALAAANDVGLVAITGECPTVGYVGGYVQGGGHSGLSTSFGLAADNTLSFDVVTPTGEMLVASRSQNSDLYWALSGGGGGNYGVVVSMTARAHPDAMVSGAKFAITPEDPNDIYDIIDAFHEELPAIVDSGVMIIYFFGQGFLQSPAMTVFNKTKEQTVEILKPLTLKLADMGVELKPNFTQFDGYHEHYDNYWGPLPAGNIQVGTSVFGGRLIPRKAIADFGPTAHKLVDMGVTFIGVGTNVSSFGKDNANAVLPQWRDALVQASLTLPTSFDKPFEDMVISQNKITDEVQPLVEAATPGAGAYMNEADFQQPNFQETFFGTNYAKLSEIKKKYDPKDLLYAVIAVGSENWDIKEDGRMCRA